MTQQIRRVRQLGELLVDAGRLTPEQLETALAEQRRTGRLLGRLLVELGFLSEADLVEVLASQAGLRFVDLNEYPVDPMAVSLIGQPMARRHLAMPIGYEDGRLVVAMSNPGNLVAIDDIRAMTQLEVRPVVATKADILNALDRFNRVYSDVEGITAAVVGDTADDDLTAVTEVVEDAPIVKLVNLLITQAVQDRASDIHIEPQERDLRVRYRIDGVLHEVMRPPKAVQAGMLSRFKIMADINIAERRIPQDGRVSLQIQGKSIDLRVATLPTVFGEKIVLRILDKSSVLLKLSDLGFAESNFARYEESYRKPYGMILVTGPTGSGKSTTLYATLNIVNDISRNIITVEDPVEYRLPGINQIQVNNKAGLTFASALRSILRSDPDIILIGEIRDRETAQIAVEAALTGHLVLTTLHTNDASSAISRLTEMGIEPFLVSSAASSVLAQRLARKLCKRCRQAYQPTPEALREARWDVAIPEDFTLYRAIGCTACGKTGYLGRVALHEVMSVTEEIERLCVERRSSEDINRMAVEQGMVTLRQDGLAKVAQGITSIEEILRVVV